MVEGACLQFAPFNPARSVSKNCAKEAQDLLDRLRPSVASRMRNESSAVDFFRAESAIAPQTLTRRRGSGYNEAMQNHPHNLSASANSSAADRNTLGGSAADSNAEAQLRLRAGKLALGLGVLIFFGKWVAYFVTGSTAVYSDAMESVVNVTAGLMLLYSLHIADRPADRDHPYGHGKIEFFSSGIEGAMICFAAVLIFVEAVRSLVEHRTIERVDYGLLILIVASVCNGLLGLYLIRTGQHTKSVALVADGKHLLTDVYTSFGVVGGLFAIWITDWVWLDPLIALGMSGLILSEGGKLVREAIRGLMDEADRDLLEKFVAVLETKREPWHIDVHGLRVWRSGRLHHLDLHLCLPRYFDIEREHQINDALEAVIFQELGVEGEGIFHFDPCRPRQCAACKMSDCQLRSAAFVQRPPITLESATRGDETLDAGIPVSHLGAS